MIVFKCSTKRSTPLVANRCSNSGRLAPSLRHEIVEAAPDRGQGDLVFAPDRGQDVGLHQIGERQSKALRLGGPDDRAKAALPGEPAAHGGFRHAQVMGGLANGVGRRLARINVVEGRHE